MVEWSRVVTRPRVGVAVLTMGNRPVELRALLDSVAMQDEPPARVVVVGNGAPLPELPEGVTAVEVPENLGVSGGRNVAMERLREFGDVDVLVDLDDDGLLVERDVFTRIADLYETDPKLGIVSFRIADEHGETQRRHVPRLRAKDPMRGGLVTTFLGGGHALSMPMLERTGGWPEEFFFTHEETDLAWRALDDGWKVLYEPRLLLQHPKTSPARHAVYYRMTARNRVWLAKRNLPAPLVPLYLGSWTALTLLRTRSGEGLKAWAGGFAEGVREPCGERKPMKWSTVWWMAKLGRPPVI
ncbi:glycosyl transferase [Streptomyces inusitatus]|uniref:Glycosyl transferase n=1 Tax=Streptomyces inusitatus TaxID=68221 RepID=A0A918PWC5_9ACTN|nr:glycosyltransferase [Streptomyces inusitatus]GGZ25203.1 glycosyl transferase [Streptomyces inusitatus]